MADKNKLKQIRLQRRQWSARNNGLFGTSERPRLSVFRSDKHIYAQVIDDMSGKTLVAASSAQKDVRGDLKNGGNVAAAKIVGKASRIGILRCGQRMACPEDRSGFERPFVVGDSGLGLQAEDLDVERRCVGEVVRRDGREAREGVKPLRQLAGDVDAELLALQRVRPGNEKERPVQADVEAAEFHAATTRSRPPAR